MAEHLLSNVYQMGGGDITHPWDAASYLILGANKKENICIDFGSQLGFEALKLSCAEIGVPVESITKILSTHVHFDHTAAAPQIDAPLYIHEAGLEAVQKRDEDLTATFLYDGQTYPEIKNVITINDGFETNVGRTALRAFHTPGHSPDSLSWQVVTPEGTIWVVGDLLWGGYHKRMGSNFDDWVTSLDILPVKESDNITFGHGVSKLVPNALKHMNLARSLFGRDFRFSHGGALINLWADPPRVAIGANRRNRRGLLQYSHGKTSF